MPHCYECKLWFSSIYLFKRHLNVSHKLNANFTCSICKSIFQSKKAFIKHVSKSLCSTNDMEIEIEPSIQPIIELGNDLSSSTNNQQNSSEFPLEYIPKIDLPNLAPLNTTNTTQFEKIIISCFSNLYGDFGLSRKDAENILSKFVKTLILPLLSHTENLILPLLNTADKIKMCSEFKYIRDIFAELGTYLLNIWKVKIFTKVPMFMK